MLGSSKNREETPYFDQKNTHVSKYIKKNILDIIQSVLTRNTQTKALNLWLVIR